MPADSSALLLALLQVAERAPRDANGHATDPEGLQADLRRVLDYASKKDLREAKTMKHKLTQEVMDLSQFPNKDRDPLDREGNGKKAARRFDADGYDVATGKPATDLNSLEAVEAAGYGPIENVEQLNEQIERLIEAIQSSEFLSPEEKQAKTTILRKVVDSAVSVAESRGRLKAGVKARILEHRRRKAGRGKLSRSSSPRPANLLESLFGIRKEHLLGDRGSEQFAQALLR